MYYFWLWAVILANWLLFSNHLFSQRHSTSWCYYNQTHYSCCHFCQCIKFQSWHCFFSSYYTSSFCSFWSCWQTHLFDKHAPLKSTNFRAHSPSPWFSPLLKKNSQFLSVILNVSGIGHIPLMVLQTFALLPIYIMQQSLKPKRAYNSSLISSSITNPRHLWKSINTILHRSSLPALPTYDSLSALSHFFDKLFSDKIQNFIPRFCSITHQPLLIYILHLLLLASHPLHLLLLMLFLTCYLTLLVQVLIWILFLLLFCNFVLMFSSLLSLISPIYLFLLVSFLISSKVALFVLTSKISLGKWRSQ